MHESYCGFIMFYFTITLKPYVFVLLSADPLKFRFVSLSRHLCTWYPLGFQCFISIALAFAICLFFFSAFIWLRSLGNLWGVLILAYRFGVQIYFTFVFVWFLSWMSWSCQALWHWVRACVSSQHSCLLLLLRCFDEFILFDVFLTLVPYVQCCCWPRGEQHRARCVLGIQQAEGCTSVGLAAVSCLLTYLS